MAWYAFDGDATEQVSGQAGVVNGARLTTNRFGEANSAYYFDGSQSIVGGAFDWPNPERFSITFWAKPDVNQTSDPCDMVDSRFPCKDNVRIENGYYNLETETRRPADS